MINSSQIVKASERTKSVARKAAFAALEFLLPARCPSCSQKILQHGFLCGGCWASLEPLAAPFCDHCALPFEFETEGENTCGACLQVSPAFDWARAAVTYSDLGRSLVLKLKYTGVTTGVPVMATMMAQVLRGKSVDLIIPVPLHRRRLFGRRFNQSQLLGEALSKKLQVPADNFILRRKKSTPSQGGLNKKARYRNVAAAFGVQPKMKAQLKGRHVLLVDDVLTTGATANECAKVLKRAGAASVGVIAFARVGQPVAG